MRLFVFYLLPGKVNSVFTLLRYVPMLILLLMHRVSAAEEQMDRREHPYLFFDAEGLKRLRVRLENEPLKSRWDVFLRNAEHCLTVPVAKDGGQWDRKRARASLKICGLTALAYAVTGDARFGDRAKAELFPVLSATRWMNPGNERFTRGAEFDAAGVAGISYAEWGSVAALGGRSRQRELYLLGARAFIFFVAIRASGGAGETRTG